MSNLLRPEEIDKKLESLEVEWSVIGGTMLNRVYTFDDFKSALNFVNKVGEIADDLDHHPDIALSWGKVEVNITTHSQNGLTERDFELASKL